MIKNLNIMTDKPIDIVGIGNSIVDIIAYKNNEFLQTYELEHGHMNLVNKEKLGQIYEHIGSSTKCSGGSVANTMVGMADLGAKTAFIGKVAGDEFGELFIDDLEKNNVEFLRKSNVKSSDSASDFTGSSVILVTSEQDEEGNNVKIERTMATYLGISANISEEDIEEEVIKNAKLIFIEGYLFDSESAQKAIDKATKLAKKYNAKIVFTLADPSLVERHHEKIYSMVKDSVDILLCNHKEAGALLKTDSIETIAEQLSKLVNISVFTQSHLGSYIIHGEHVYRVEPRMVDVYDITGAGDLYAAGFLYAYLKNYDFEVCGLLGSYCASEVIQYIGARPIRSLKDVLNEVIEIAQEDGHEIKVIA